VLHPSPDTAPHRLMPDMRGFLSNPRVRLAWVCARALFLPWLRHCLPRIGMRQSSKVSKTVNSSAALLRCVANAYEKYQNSLHTARVQDIANTGRFVQRVHQGKNPRTNKNLPCTCQPVQRLQSAKHHARTHPTLGDVRHLVRSLLRSSSSAAILSPPPLHFQVRWGSSSRTSSAARKGRAGRARPSPAPARAKLPAAGVTFDLLFAGFAAIGLVTTKLFLRCFMPSTRCAPSMPPSPAPSLQ
jgi:hypothetical protein